MNGAPKSPQLSAAEYIQGIRRGDRVILGRAITLVESNSPGHQDLAQEVLAAVLPDRVDSLRVGITGVPGAGKSTFIEALGKLLTGQGHKVAVTAVDPSSSLTGGSILGDKTRMAELAVDERAFIRPSPSGGALGGVARKTRETIVLFEAAGFDVVLVETVGVGQSEVLVRSLVDFFLLMLIPGAGDELQGIKRGVVELADAIVLNKADGSQLQAAEQSRADFERALGYLRPATEGWQTGAWLTSARTGTGIPEIWSVVQEFRTVTIGSGALARRRAEQDRQWVRSLVQDGLLDLMHAKPGFSGQMSALEEKVASGELPATTAARQLLDLFRPDPVQ